MVVSYSSAVTAVQEPMPRILCEDLAKCTLRDFESQKRLKVLSLTDNTAGIMAWANDEGYDRIFVEQLKNLASPG